MGTQEDLQLAKLDAEADLARAQIDKTRAEARELGKPLFLKSGFYIALAPVAVAIAGLVFTKLSGWFDVQNDKLKAENTRLDAVKERTLAENARLEAVKERIQADTALVKVDKVNVEADKKALEVQRAEVAAELAKERESFAKAKVELEEQFKREQRLLTAQLQQERQRFDEAKAELETQLATSQKKLQAMPFDIHLQSIADGCATGVGVDPNHPAFKALVAILESADDSRRHDCRVRIDEQLGSEISTCERSLLLYATYRGTGDRGRFDALLEQTRLHGITAAYQVFAFGAWDDADYFELCRCIVSWTETAARALDPIEMQEACYVLAKSSSRSGILAGFADDAAFMDAVLFARGVALNPSLNNSVRDAGFAALGGLAPSAWCAAYAVLTKGEWNSVLLPFLIETRADPGTFGEDRLVRACNQLSIPSDHDREAWSRWMQRDTNAELVGAWLQPDLTVLRRNRELLVRLAAVGEVTGDVSTELESR